MQKPVEKRGGDHGVSKNISPFCKAAIRCQDNCPFLVAGVDELEEQIAAAGDDREITDLVDDPQTWPAEEADAFLQPSLALGPGQRCNEIGQGAEVDALARFDSFDAERDSQMALPVPGGPRKWAASCLSTKPSCASVKIRSRSSEGWKEKSKPASVLMVASRPIRNAVLCDCSRAGSALRKGECRSLRAPTARPAPGGGQYGRVLQGHVASSSRQGGECGRPSTARHRARRPWAVLLRHGSGDGS